MAIDPREYRRARRRPVPGRRGLRGAAGRSAVEGDHAIFIGRVERYASAGTDRLPLVFCQGGYMAPQLLAAA